MLARKHKAQLRTNQVFFHDAKKIKFNGGLIYYQPNSECFKASVIVAKKNAKLSTVRIKIKRQVYQAVQDLLPQIESWKISVAIVIISPNKTNNQQRLREELMTIFKIIKQNEKSCD